MKDNDIFFHSLIRQVVIFLKISSTEVLPKRREKKKYSKGGRRREKKTKIVFSWLNIFFSFFKKWIQAPVPRSLCRFSKPYRAGRRSRVARSTAGSSYAIFYPLIIFLRFFVSISLLLFRIEGYYSYFEIRSLTVFTDVSDGEESGRKRFIGHWSCEGATPRPRPVRCEGGGESRQARKQMYSCLVQCVPPPSFGARGQIIINLELSALLDLSYLSLRLYSCRFVLIRTSRRKDRVWGGDRRVRILGSGFVREFYSLYLLIYTYMSLVQDLKDGLYISV